MEKITMNTVDNRGDNMEDNIHVLWSNYVSDYDPEDFREDFIEIYEHEPDEYELFGFASDTIYEYLLDDIANLEAEQKESEILWDKKHNYQPVTFYGEIELGRWNGNQHGILKISSLEEMMELYPDCWYGRFYTQGEDFKSHQSHHDGDVDITYYYVNVDEMRDVEMNLDEGNFDKAKEHMKPMGFFVNHFLGWD